MSEFSRVLKVKEKVDMMVKQARSTLVLKNANIKGMSSKTNLCLPSIVHLPREFELGLELDLSQVILSRRSPLLSM